MRRKDRQVTDWQEICAILDACQVLHLGLQGADGPYVVPLSFGWEEQAGRIVLYFHGASAGKRPRCWRRSRWSASNAPAFFSTFR